MVRDDSHLSQGGSSSSGNSSSSSSSSSSSITVKEESEVVEVVWGQLLSLNSYYAFIKMFHKDVFVCCPIIIIKQLLCPYKDAFVMRS